jgi:WD40 repeat protein
VSDDEAAVTLWDWPARRKLFALGGHIASISTLAFAPDGRLLASGDPSGLVIVREVLSGRERLRLTVSGFGLAAVAFTRGGALIATADSSEPVVRLWDASNGSPRGTLPTAPARNAMAAAPAAGLLAVARIDGVADLWGPDASRPLGSARADAAPLCAVALTPDGRLLATGDKSGVVRVWDLPRLLGTRSPGAVQ